MTLQFQMRADMHIDVEPGFERDMGFSGKMPLLLKLLVYQAVLDFFMLKPYEPELKTPKDVRKSLKKLDLISSAYRFLFADHQNECDFGAICRKFGVDPEERRRKLLEVKYLGGEDVLIYCGFYRGRPGDFESRSPQEDRNERIRQEFQAGQAAEREQRAAGDGKR